MITAFILIVIHYIGDFICQSDEMAQGKSKSNKWLTINVLTYNLVLSIGLWIWLLFTDGLIEPAVYYFLIAKFILHWVTDYFTSRLNSYLWGKKMVHWFFVGVGGDQVIHYACLLGTYSYFNLPQ